MPEAVCTDRVKPCAKSLVDRNQEQVKVNPDRHALILVKASHGTFIVFIGMNAYTIRTRSDKCQCHVFSICCNGTCSTSGDRIMFSFFENKRSCKAFCFKSLAFVYGHCFLRYQPKEYTNVFAVWLIMTLTVQILATGAAKKKSPGSLYQLFLEQWHILSWHPGRTIDFRLFSPGK